MIAEIVQIIDRSLGDFIAMGGKGSGHWGHKGRKGKRGGSAPSKGGGAPGVAKFHEAIRPSAKKSSLEELSEQELEFAHVSGSGEHLFVAKDEEGYITAAADVDIYTDTIKGVKFEEAYVYYVESVDRGGGSSLVAGLFEKVDVIGADVATQEGAEFFKRRGFIQTVPPEESSYAYGSWSGISPNIPASRQKDISSALRQFYELK